MDTYLVADLSQLIVKIFVFEPPSVHLGLMGKRVVNFLLVIIELFLLDVTAEALRANWFKIGAG